MRGSRLVNLLVAIAAGVVFLAGLLTSGALATVLLLGVAAFLVLLSAAAWPSLPPRGRGMRVVVVTVVLAIAAVKLATA